MKAFIITEIEWLLLQTENDLDDIILSKVKDGMSKQQLRQIHDHVLALNDINLHIMSKTFTCPICLNVRNYINDTSCFCDICKCLINLKVKQYDYKGEGGQNIPDKNKHYLRIENCKLRFKIIK